MQASSPSPGTDILIEFSGQVPQPVQPPPRPRGLDRCAEDTPDRLFERWHDDADQDARAELVRRFLPVAERLAGRYRNSLEPLDDLVQVACVGLVRAIDRFDPGRGIPFRAFAIPTILGELKRHFRDTGWSAHVPRGAQDLAVRVEHAVRVLAERGRLAPTPGEIAEFLQIDLADVLTGLDAGGAHFSASLDAPVNRGASELQVLADSLGRHEDGYDLIDVKLSLASEIAGLRPRERAALQLRMERGLKQNEIARELGCSQMQVSRLLRAAAEHIHEQIDA